MGLVKWGPHSPIQLLEAEPPLPAVWGHQEFGLQVGTLGLNGLHRRDHLFTGHNALGLGDLQPIEDVCRCQLGGSWHEHEPWEGERALSWTGVLSLSPDGGYLGSVPG